MKTAISTFILFIGMLNLNAQETSQISKKDKKFVLKASLAGTNEVKLAELALSKSNSAEVKALAQHMVESHTMLNEELKAFADKKNVLAPTELDNHQRKCYYKLSKIEREKFDKKYVKLMKKEHKKAICLFKKAAKKSEDPELKSWAAAKLPILEHHLEMTKTTMAAI